MDRGPDGLPFKKRLKRYDTPGDAHFLTFSCYRRQRFLDADHNNPVKRGLCETPQNWKWSSARSYSGLDDGPVPIDVITM